MMQMTRKGSVGVCEARHECDRTSDDTVIVYIVPLICMAAWRNGNASDYDYVIRRLQVRPLRWSESDGIIFSHFLDVSSA